MTWIRRWQELETGGGGWPGLKMAILHRPPVQSVISYVQGSSYNMQVLHELNWHTYYINIQVLVNMASANKTLYFHWFNNFPPFVAFFVQWLFCSGPIYSAAMLLTLCSLTTVHVVFERRSSKWAEMVKNVVEIELYKTVCNEWAEIV